MSGRNAARLGSMAVLAGILWVAGAPAFAQSSSLTVDAQVNERDLESSSGDRPIALDPNEPVVLDLSITNEGENAVVVDSIRLEGVIMGVPFYSYDTAVGVSVPPGATEERSFELNMLGLNGQAVGLQPSQLILMDEERETLHDERFVADVKGDWTSTFGLFGIAVAIMTVLTTIGILVRMARHKLPRNRWSRGLLFLTPGIGLALTLIYATAAFRVWVPGPTVWAPILTVCVVGSFMLGYLSPGGHDEEEIEEAEDLGLSLERIEGRAHVLVLDDDKVPSAPSPTGSRPEPPS